MGTGRKAPVGRGAAALASAAVSLLCAAALATGAEAELLFCPQGEANGQCDQAYGTATELETGRLYVADRGNDRVQAFEADGEFKFSVGGLSNVQWVAVDNVEGSPFKGYFYVGTPGFEVRRYDDEGNFDKAFGSGVKGQGECELGRQIDPVAVGPGGVLYVGDSYDISSPFPAPTEYESQAQLFDPETSACVEEVKLEGLQGGSAARIRQMAVDSEGNIYVTVEAGEAGVQKYSPTGERLDVWNPDYVTQGLGFDGEDNLYAAQVEKRARGFGTHSVITLYNPAGEIQSRFGYGELEGNVRGTAPYASALGDVFASDNSDSAAQLKYLDLSEPGPIVPPSSVEVLSIGNTRAEVAAEVNPEGEPSEFYFEYVKEAEFEESGFEGPGVKKTPAEAVDATGDPEEFQVHTVEATLGCEEATIEKIESEECMNPQTDYRFRAIATNADNPEGEGEARAEGPAFETKEPLEIEALFASQVGTDAARLSAAVDPLGIPASGYFEYVSEAEFEAGEWAGAKRVPAEAELDFGGGEGAVTETAPIGSLEPGTTYLYRFLATNALLEGAYLTAGPNQLTTYEPAQVTTGCPNDADRLGEAAYLPDCRAYELVSPLDKEGGDIVVLGDPTTVQPAVLNQSSVAGSRLAYGSYRAFGDAKSGAYTSQYIAERTAGGWLSHGISPLREEPVVSTLNGFETEFKLFSDDLCRSWLRSFAEPPLAEDAIPGYSNIYRWVDPECGSLGYAAITTEQPDPGGLQLELQGVSASGATAIYAASDDLVPPAPDLGSVPQLYAERGGETVFACVRPGGEPSPVGCSGGGPAAQAFSAGGRRIQLQNAISADGNRIFWSEQGGGIYLRENPFGEGAECSGGGTPCSTAVSEGGEEASGTTSSQYWGAAEDGSVALYSTGSLTTGSADLYAYDVEGEATVPIAGEVYGVAGISSDASRAYLVSGEAIAGTEGAEEGKPNLYLYEAGEGEEAGSHRFIGTLSAADARTSGAVTNEGSSVVASEPRFHATRVTPDGSHLAFTSTAPLTGYDNTDAASGEADAEVFLYDAGGEGELRCVSCDPGGGRPEGENASNEGTFWVAARIPVWQNSLWAARVLTADGSRLYFESYDSLTARDTNGARDVYQWEEPGEGSCLASRPSFSPAAGGCVELISSGSSEKDATFVEATPDGSDVFFSTLSSLLPQDYGLVDVYDARELGGLPVPPPPPVECEGQSCQSPPPAPAPVTPSSLLYQGPGDLPAPKKANKKKKRCAKGKRKVKRKGKVRCVKKKGAKGERRSARRSRHLRSGRPR